MKTYKRNLDELFETCRRVLKPETLFIWTTALPVSQSVRGGVILDTIRFLSDVLRYDVLHANSVSSRAAAKSGFDVVDLHYEMRRHIDMRMPDGIHWNSQAHRKITGILLYHVCLTWNVRLPVRVAVGFSRLGLSWAPKKPEEALRETAAGDDQRDAASGSLTEESSRADSEKQNTPCGIGDGLLPTPGSRPQQAFARRGRRQERFSGAGNRALCAPSMSVGRDVSLGSI